MHMGVAGCGRDAAMYIFLLSCREGGKEATGARDEHCCSANRAVDVVYVSEHYDLVSKIGQHTHTTHLVVAAPFEKCQEVGSGWLPVKVSGI